MDIRTLAPNPNVTTLGSLVSAVVHNAFIFAGVIAFFLLLFGGFQIIVSGGNPKKTEQGKAAVTGAVVGLLVIFGSFWIVQTISALTGKQILPGM